MLTIKLCKSAAWQLNVLYRFKGIIDIKEKEIMYNTFISTTVPLYDISAVKLHLKKLKIFKKEPYVLCSMIKSVLLNPF